MGYAGAEFHGELHSTDASSGVAIPIYRSGTAEAITVDDDQYLDIHSIQLISAAGGDCYVFCGADSTLGTGETIVRGTVAANGGIVMDLRPHYSGIKGGTLFVVAPAGAVDVVVQGTIRDN